MTIKLSFQHRRSKSGAAIKKVNYRKTLFATHLHQNITKVPNYSVYDFPPRDSTSNSENRFGFGPPSPEIWSKMCSLSVSKLVSCQFDSTITFEGSNESSSGFLLSIGLVNISYGIENQPDPPTQGENNSIKRVKISVFLNKTFFCYN